MSVTTVLIQKKFRKQIHEWTRWKKREMKKEKTWIVVFSLSFRDLVWLRTFSFFPRFCFVLDSPIFDALIWIGKSFFSLIIYVRFGSLKGMYGMLWETLKRVGIRFRILGTKNKNILLWNTNFKAVQEKVLNFIKTQISLLVISATNSDFKSTYFQPVDSTNLTKLLNLDILSCDKLQNKDAITFAKPS